MAQREGPLLYFRQSSGEMAASKYAHYGWDHNSEGLLRGPLVLVGSGAKKQTASDRYTTYRARWPHEALGRVVIETSPVPSGNRPGVIDMPSPWSIRLESLVRH